MLLLRRAIFALALVVADWPEPAFAGWIACNNVVIRGPVGHSPRYKLSSTWHDNGEPLVLGYRMHQPGTSDGRGSWSDL